MVGIYCPPYFLSYLTNLLLNLCFHKGEFKLMISWFARPIIYIRIKPDWLSVKILIKGKEPSLYENTPEVVYRPKIGSPNIEILGVGKDTTVFSSLNQAAEVKRGNAFNHPRSLVKDFELASETLKYFIFKAKEKNKFFILFSPCMIIHPLDKLEGGLTSVEKVTFIDLGLQAGAGLCYLCEEVRELSDEIILSIAIAKKEKVK